MSCKRCGLKLNKNDRFVLVGFYPDWLIKSGFPRFFGDLEYFGELYHETCYLEPIERREPKQKESVKP